METGGSAPSEVVLKTVSTALDEALAVPLSTMSVDELGDWVCAVESELAAKFAALQARSVQAADDACVGPCTVPVQLPNMWRPVRR